MVFEGAVVDGACGAGAGPAGTREADRGGAPVVGDLDAVDEAVDLHALHQAAEAGLAVPHAHQCLQLAQAHRAPGAVEVGQDRVRAGVDAGFLFELADDLAQDGLVHVDERAPELGCGGVGHGQRRGSATTSSNSPGTRRPMAAAIVSRS